MAFDHQVDRGVRAGVRRLFRLPLRGGAFARRDADDELEAYIDARVDHLVARGMSPAAARIEALERLGASVDDARASLRRSAERRDTYLASRDLLEDLRQDLAYAWRQVRKSPAFTAIAVLTLALGIGANTAIYSVVHRLLVAPLPYASGNRIVALTQAFGDGSMLFPVQGPLVEAWKARAHSIEVFGGSTTRALRFDELPAQDTVRGALITPSFLRIIDASPALGRAFVDSDAVPVAAPIAMISTRLWKQQFGSRRDVIGSVMHIAGQPYTIVGVAPMSGDMPRQQRVALRRGASSGPSAAPDIWLPATPDSVGDWFAKLRPGTSAAAASSELDAIMKSLPDPQNTYARSSARAMRAQDFLDAREVRTIQVLFLAVGLLLLIACVNVANLLLARAWSRRRERAVRIALGAGRARLVRQVLTESLTLALIGGVLGALLASRGLRLIIALRPPALDHLADVGLEPSVLLWTFGVSLLTGVLFSAAPALFASGAVAGDVLRTETRSASGGTASRRTRSTLVVAEVALSLVLLVGAGLLVRAFLLLQQTPLGFEPRGLVSIGVLVPPRSADRVQRIAIRNAVLERLRAVPGVTAAASGTLPGNGFIVGAEIELQNNDAAVPTGIRASTTTFITPDYFRVARIALLQGRVMDSTTAGSENDVLINRSLAERLWPGGAALGRRFRAHGGIALPWRTVVGVVSDVQLPGVSGDRDELQIYQLPPAQVPTGAYVVRTSLPGESLVPALQKAIGKADARIRVGPAMTGESLVRDALAPARFSMALLGAFAVVALLLAMVGLYGVIAYGVTQRTREIGVRTALGASSSAVARLIVGDGLRLVGAGLAVGLAAAAATSRVITSLLYGMSPLDPVTYLGISGVVVVIALIATYAPARRAMRIDPMEALRAE
jgi:predicted permease